MIFANIFGSRSDASEPTPADALAGVRRAQEHARARLADFTARHQAAEADVLRVDDARRAVVVAAKSGDTTATATLDALNAERRRHEDNARDLAEAMAQTHAELVRLADEERAAQRGQLTECVRRLVEEQATLGAALDGEFSALASRLRRWVELDLLVTDHAAKLGVTPGRHLLHRLQDALSGAVYDALPAVAQANAIDLHISVTGARRHATFASVSAIHGPAGEIARPPAQQEA